MPQTAMTHNGVRLIIDTNPDQNLVKFTNPDCHHSAYHVTAQPRPHGGWTVKGHHNHLPAAEAADINTVFDYAALYFKMKLDHKTLRDRARNATATAINDLMHAVQNYNATPDVPTAPTG